MPVNQEQRRNPDATNRNAGSRNAGSRAATEKWRRLPARIAPEEMIESVPENPPPSSAAPAGDPDTSWMLRYS